MSKQQQIKNDIDFVRKKIKENELENNPIFFDFENKIKKGDRRETMVMLMEIYIHERSKKENDMNK